MRRFKQIVVTFCTGDLQQNYISHKATFMTKTRKSRVVGKKGHFDCRIPPGSIPIHSPLSILGTWRDGASCPVLLMVNVFVIFNYEFIVLLLFALCIRCIDYLMQVPLLLLTVFYLRAPSAINNTIPLFQINPECRRQLQSTSETVPHSPLRCAVPLCVTNARVKSVCQKLSAAGYPRMERQSLT